MREMENEINRVMESYKSPIFFSSAHVSMLAGIPSYSEKICGYSLNETLSVEFWKDKSVEFFSVFKKIFQWADSSPTFLHKMLAELDVPIITENIDSLHQKAGSTNVVELYGNMKTIVCENCCYRINTEVFLKQNKQQNDNENIRINCPNCSSLLQPDLVLLGQHIRNFHKAVNMIYESDALVILGTEPLYYPCNNLIIKAEINNCPINYLSIFK